MENGILVEDLDNAKIIKKENQEIKNENSNVRSEPSDEAAQTSKEKKKVDPLIEMFYAEVSFFCYYFFRNFSNLDSNLDR